MRVPVIMPRLELKKDNIRLIEWLKVESDQVIKGEPLFRVEFIKSTFDVKAPDSGILSEIIIQPNEIVPIGSVLAYLQ